MDAFSQLSAWPAPSVSVAVVGLDRPSAVHGDPRQVFGLASVSKLLTAYAVLVAVDQGLVTLDRPAGPPGSTVAHLLAHASGLAPDGTAALAAAGTRRIYSNTGFDVVAAATAEAVGQPFADWLATAVLTPLGMGATRLVGSPASAMTSTTEDLIAFATELLEPTLVTPTTYLTATSVAFPGLSGVLPGFGRQDPNDWGLGFERRDAKRPHWTGTTNSPETFGHFGRSGTFLWVDPMAELACVCLTDLDFGPWAADAWPPFADAVLAEASS